MASDFLENLVTGIRRRWRQGAASALAMAGAIWLAIEICSAAWPQLSKLLEQNAITYLCSIFLFCLITFLYRSFEPLSITIKIPTTSNFIRLKYGNLFDERDSGLVIPVNEFFDYQMGHIVSPSSTHGGFINFAFGGDGAAFRDAVDSGLDAAIAEPTQRVGDRFNKYPLGTVVRLPMGHRLAFLVAIANTDIETSKASTSVDRLWRALEELYRSIRDYGGGQPFAMPLVGNGRSNLNLPPQHVLRLLILSIVTFARREGMTSDITVVLPRACLEYLDLKEIKKDWN